MATKETSAVDLLALSRLGHLNMASSNTAKDVRGEIAPGEYSGQVPLWLEYNIKVGEDHEAEVAASVPWQKMCGALLSRINHATREKILREQMLKELMGKTTKTVAGKVTGSAHIFELED